MKRPTEAEIEEARKLAAARGSFAVLLEYDDPDVDSCVIVATMTAKDWSTYADISARDAGDAHGAAFVEQTLWPKGDELEALGEATPALRALVASDLREMAGGGRTHERIRLTADLRPAELARFGLTAERVAALLSEHGSAKLSAVRIAGEPPISLVVKSPMRPVYQADLAAYQRAQGANAGIHDAAMQAARDMVVSSSPSLEDIERTCPAVVANNLLPIFVDVGGAGAKAQRRRL